LNLGVVGGKTAAGSPITQWNDDGSANQKWRCESVGGRYYALMAGHSGLVLNVPDASAADGVPITQWPLWSADNERWQLLSAGDGYYYIVAKHSEKVITVLDGSRERGAKVVQMHPQGLDNQKWSFVETAAPLAFNCNPPETRYNEVRQIASHNSYDRCGMNRFECVPKPDLPQQADAGVRSFELDIHQGGAGLGDSPDFDWDVYHFGGGAGDYCGHLSECLAKLRRWHNSHTNHEVITVWLELKSGWEGGGHKPVDLDNNRLARDFDGVLFTPVDMLSNCPGSASLQDAVRRCGWPTLATLRGKFIIVLMADEQRNLADYLFDVNYYRGGPSAGNNGYRGNKIAFVAPDIQTYEASEADQDGWQNAVFFNIHNRMSDIAASADNGWVPAKAVFQKKLVSRAWRIDSPSEWARARENFAQHLATEHVSQDLFEPRAVDSCGKPMQLIVPRRGE
jgi:hypothetical protein